MHRPGGGDGPAFIVVASVFVYVALGAGFFTTQRTEQTVYSAVRLAPVVRVVEPVVVQAGTSGDSIRSIVMMVKTPRGADIDVERVVATVSTVGTMQTYTGAARWRPMDGGGGGMPVFWQVRIPLFQADDPALPGDLFVGQNRRFFVEPRDAVPCTVERRAPAGMSPGGWHEV